MSFENDGWLGVNVRMFCSDRILLVTRFEQAWWIIFVVRNEENLNLKSNRGNIIIHDSMIETSLSRDMLIARLIILCRSGPSSSLNCFLTIFLGAWKILCWIDLVKLNFVFSAKFLMICGPSLPSFDSLWSMWHFRNFSMYVNCNRQNFCKNSNYHIL